MPPCKHRRAVGTEPGQLEIFDAPRLDQLLDDGFDGCWGDAVVGQLELVRDVSCGTHRARRADRTFPTAPAKDRSNRAKLEPHREPSALETFGAELAVGEMLATDTDAADVKAFEMLRLVALADDDLRATAADVDDEVRSVRGVGVVRDAEVDEARLFDAGDHLDGMTERLFGLGEKRVRVARATQRVRADDAHLVSAACRATAGQSGADRRARAPGSARREVLDRRDRRPDGPSRATDRRSTARRADCARRPCGSYWSQDRPQP